MITDVNNYVQRWANSYIVYHTSRLEGYGDISKGENYFNQKYQQEIAKMEDRALTSQIEAQLALMDKSKREAISGLEIIDELKNGGLMEEIMEKLAGGINSGIQEYYDQVGFDNFDTVIQQSKKYNGALQKGKMSPESVDAFFNLILQGLSIAGGVDPDIFIGVADSRDSKGKAWLGGLSELGKRLTGITGYTFNPGTYTTAKVVTKENVETTEKILRYLSNAVEKLQKNGAVSYQSFSSTINNIFSTVEGEMVAKRLLAKGIRNLYNTADQAIMDGLTGLGKKGNVTVTINPKSKMTLGGSRHDTEGRTSKVDIFNQKAFTLTVTENGMSYDIQLGLNTSVKWYKHVNSASSISAVNGTPLGHYFKEGTEETYLGYNIIAHRFSGEKQGMFHLGYRAVRAATAATFFNEWLAGTGAFITTKGGNVSKAFNNTVQFLMINGKVYSVMSIIKNICNELFQLNSIAPSKTMPINMSIPNKSINHWEGTRDPDIIEGMNRSKLVNEALSKLEIAAKLNGNILTKYTYAGI